MTTLPAQTSPPIHHRKRFWLILVIIVGLLAWVARVACNSTTVRASAVRAAHRAELQNIAQAMRLYQEQHGRIGTLGDLIAAGLITQNPSVSFAQIKFNVTSGPTSGPRLLFVQRTPEPPVKKGDPWGGPDETADRDMPACRYVMYDDLAVGEVTEDEFQKSMAAQITLLP